MSEYTTIESLYIKNRIKGLSWEKHSYIDNLIRLYNFIKLPPTHWLADMQFAALKSQYIEEYLDLLKEYSLELYARELRRRKEFLEEREKCLQEMKKDEYLSKEDWLRAGGIL